MELTQGSVERRYYVLAVMNFRVLLSESVN
jgi:hypothetical protein